MAPTHDRPDLGREAARLKWHEGLTWPEVFERFPDEAPAKVRSAARRYKEAHPDDFPHAETPFAVDPEDLGVRFEEAGNTAEASSLSTQIKCPQDLIEASGIDTDIWEPTDDCEIKSYDGWRANTQKHLVWKERAIDHGFVKSGGIITQTLWSVRVRFVKKNPRPLEPTFQIIRCPVQYAPPQIGDESSWLRAVLLSDVHLGFDKDLRNGKLIPFHDRRALDVIVQIASVYQPNFIAVLGDYFDLTRWTKRYAHEPEFFWTTQPALFEGYWLLRRIRHFCPNTRIIWIEGNHEVRMPNFIRDHMIEAYGLSGVTDRFPALSMPQLLNLDALQVEWIDGYEADTAQFRPVPWMIWEHGNIARAVGNTAKAIVERSVCWRFSGHTHRCEVASRSFEELEDDPRPPVSSIQFGCVCHADGRVPGSSPGAQWQQGFGIVEFGREESPPTVEIIPLRGGKAYWRGRLYQGRDYTEELRAVWPDWNW